MTFPAVFDVSSLNGNNGFTINGAAIKSEFGYSVAGAGDINGDGKQDLIIGAWLTNNFVGAAYVVFGSATFPRVLSVATLNGANGFKINGAASFGELGTSVAGVGDINGD